MGLSNPSVKFFCHAKSRGVDFTRTAMIGRQSFRPGVATLDEVFSILNIEEDAKQFVKENDYSEKFFKSLGAEEISSIDFSSYEGAEIIQDMNEPIPEDLKERFSMVHDGGSLEHVFNIPQALKNCMEMVEIGGHFTQVNIANNLMGHGFWQFSPELIFRVFSPANGFEIESVLLHETVKQGGWYAVPDPDKIRQRIELCNSQPTYMMVTARRISREKIFAQWPQQSDYMVLWDQNDPTPPNTNNTKDEQISKDNGKNWRDQIPSAIKKPLRSISRRINPQETPPEPSRLGEGFDKSYYTKIEEADLLRGKMD